VYDVGNSYYSGNCLPVKRRNTTRLVQPVDGGPVQAKPEKKEQGKCIPIAGNERGRPKLV